MDSILDAAAAALHKAERTAQLGAAASVISISGTVTSRKQLTDESLSSVSKTTTGKTFSQSAVGSKLAALAMAEK